MSILRFSAKRSVPLAPDEHGSASGEPYSRRARIGALEALQEPWLPKIGGDLDHALSRRLIGACAALDPSNPIIAMVHGFMFDPFHSVDMPPEDSDNAHRRLFHFREYGESQRLRLKAVSWPLDLGFADDAGETGLALAFGWHSKPGFAGSLMKGGKNFYARAYEYAEESAWVFVSFLEAIHRWLEENGHRQEIDALTHSLGSRIVVRGFALVLKHGAMTDAELDAIYDGKRDRAAARANRDRLAALARRLGRVVQMGGSEYVVEAQLMYRRLLENKDALGLETGKGLAFYNVVSRENDVLDFLGENFGPRTFGNTNVIGHNGIGLAMRDHRKSPEARWCDLPIDSADLCEWLKKRKVHISGDEPGQVWDHWMYYTFPGNMALYRAILRRDDGWSIPELVKAHMPQAIKRGWLFAD